VTKTEENTGLEKDSLKIKKEEIVDEMKRL
jgi:hypothetical protein